MTQISLRIRAVWSESSLIACAFYSLRTVREPYAILGGFTGRSESVLVSQVLLQVLSFAGSFIFTGINVQVPEYRLFTPQQSYKGVLIPKSHVLNRNSSK